MTVLAPLLPIVLTALTALAPSDEMDPEAREHFDRGLASYNDKAYASAIKDLQIAYALDPQPGVLFAWAQAERLHGRCSRATKLYSRFLKSRPSQQQTEAARQGLARCKDQPDAVTREQPEDAPADEPEDAPETTPAEDTAPTPAPPTDTPKKRRVDGLGYGLLGGGVALGTVGAALLGAGQSQARRADEGAASYEDYAADATHVHRLRIAGGVLAGVGGALIVAGVVKLVLHRRESRRDLSFWANPVGAGASFRMRF